jgi:monoamine oxidase
MIAELGYGTTAKVAALFDSRTWRESTSTGAGFDESREFWDGALRGDPDYGVLSAVLGGTPGLSSDESDADQTFLTAMPALEILFREIQTKYRPGSAVLVHWASLSSFKGSGSCYLPGQWAWRGTEARREGGLHFCGEHCSIDFQGRLEGAAETGALVAAEILEDLGLKPVSEYHATIVSLKRSVAQPYQRPVSSELGLQARVQEVTDSHAEFVADLGFVPGG